ELQRKSEPNAQEKIDQPDIEASIQTARGKGQALPENLQQPLEQAFNADFSQVRIHTDSQASQLNQSLEAKALTTGKDIFFRQGEFNPGNRGGQELIAHELTHVVQQNGGAMPQVVQRKNTLKTSDAQTTAGKDHKVKEEDKVKVKQEDIKVATQHPMYVTFQARINQVFSQFPPPDNYD
ncbi:MAG: eCIS core domain-containing protein, partial [Nostoc sp.]